MSNQILSIHQDQRPTLDTFLSNTWPNFASNEQLMQSIPLPIKHPSRTPRQDELRLVPLEFGQRDIIFLDVFEMILQDTAPSIDQLKLPLTIETRETVKIEAQVDILNKLEDDLLAKKYEGRLTLLDELKLRHIQDRKDQLLGLEDLDPEQERLCDKLEEVLNQGSELIAKIDKFLEQENQDGAY